MPFSSFFVDLILFHAYFGKRKWSKIIWASMANFAVQEEDYGLMKIFAMRRVLCSAVISD